jgi:hypothetical protein
MSLVFVSILNTAIPLPSNIQRAFSFLPGTWDEEQISDTEESTQWRVDMWEEAILTDNWIKHKWLGDGLGMTQQEYNYIESFGSNQIRAQGKSTSAKLTLQQELMMASNNYHSGPVSSIRMVGYVGLLILLLAQIRLAVYAHRQIKRARGSNWLPLTIFIGIPIIYTPFYFTFIFGDYGTAIASFLVGAAMIRVLENNLPLPTYTKHNRAQSSLSNPVLTQ